MIKRSSRVTKLIATVTDYILTNTIIESYIQSGIIKNDVSYHFAVFFLIKTNLNQVDKKNTIIKRYINEDSMNYFNYIFNSTNWELLTQTLFTNNFL